MRRAIWVVMVLVGCNVAVEGGTAGLSMGMSGGPGGGSVGDGEAEGGTNGEGTGSESGADETGASTSGTGPGPGESSGGAATGTGDPSGSTGGAPGDPLDPGLDVPDEGEPCTTPGSLVECPALEVCRFHTTEQGLCESCDACGNLGAPCVEGTDCDILFACYQGQCTNICELNTNYCGAIDDCLDVGHPTHGVCAPF